MSSALAKILLSAAWLLSSCTSHREVTQLGGCWNVNNLNTGMVRGEGIFIVSMHGLSLQAPDCSDRMGRNAFDLSKNADSSMVKFNSTRPRKYKYIQFSFSGTVSDVKNGKKLVIDDVTNLREVDAPIWMAKME